MKPNMKIFSMKKIYMILLPVLFLAASGCRSEDAYIDVQNGIELTADANDIEFAVHSNASWKMTVSDPWFKVTPKRGSGNASLRLVAERNNTGRERTSVMEFVAGNIVERVSVTQPAYEVSAEIDVPGEVYVKKGEVLAIPVDINTADWEYTLSDGDWLKEFRKTANELIFQLDPGVRFEETVPAVIEITTPSDPLFYRKFEVYPRNWFEFSVSAEDVFDLGSGGQFEILVSTNIDWDYEVRNGAWLVEYSKVRNRLVFDGNADLLLNQDTKAVIMFSNPDYANFSCQIEVQPVAPQTERKVEKSGLSVLKLSGDAGGDYENADVLFNDGWLLYWNNHNEYTEGDPARRNGVSYKAFQLNSSQDYKSETVRSFTIDAGRSLKLSKWITYHYYMYHMNDPVSYEIYAYAASGTPSGEWTSDWVRIGSYDSTGLYIELQTLENGTYCPALAEGDMISVAKEDSVYARYYRFKMLKNGYSVYGWWNGAAGPDYQGAAWPNRCHLCTISEITMYEYID